MEGRRAQRPSCSGAATEARTTWKPAPGAGAQSPCSPQRQQGRLGQVCPTKMKHKAVQPELERVRKRCHLQSVAANRTAPQQVPQPTKSCAPRRLKLHLRSPLRSLCHLHRLHLCPAPGCVFYQPATQPWGHSTPFCTVRQYQGTLLEFQPWCADCLNR